MIRQPHIIPPCSKTIQILYEDDFFLLINKPELLLSVPGRLPQNQDSLITRIQQTHPTATMVHRLDLDTSGIMVIPLQRQCHSHLSRQFQQRLVQKTYTTVVAGLVEQDQGRIELPIAADWPNRPRQKIDHENGKPALTDYEVLERNTNDHSTRLLLKPVTGRSHQLRIHLNSIGHPILGCDLYAPPEVLARSRRLLLHATSLSFAHPVIGDTVRGYCAPEF